MRNTVRCILFIVFTLFLFVLLLFIVRVLLYLFSIATCCTCSKGIISNFVVTLSTMTIKHILYSVLVYSILFNNMSGSAPWWIDWIIFQADVQWPYTGSPEPTAVSESRRAYNLGEGNILAIGFCWSRFVTRTGFTGIIIRRAIRASLSCRADLFAWLETPPVSSPSCCH